MQGQSLGSGPGFPEPGPHFQSTLLTMQGPRLPVGFLSLLVRALHHFCHLPSWPPEIMEGVTSVRFAFRVAPREDGLLQKVRSNCD